MPVPQPGKTVARLRAPASARVRQRRLDRVEDRAHDAPALQDGGEEGEALGVTDDGPVQDVLVREFLPPQHPREVDADGHGQRPVGAFGLVQHQVRADAGVAVDAEADDVRRRLDVVAAEEFQRRLAQFDHDLGGGDGQRLAAAEVEGDIGPAPVVDEHPGREVGLRGGAGLDALDVPVAVVLAAYGHGGVHGAGRVQGPPLLQPLRLGVGGARRFHHEEGEDLEHVVLDHVAQTAHRVVEGAAVRDVEVLGEGDLHVVHVGAVPDRREQCVGEPGDHQALHRTVAEEVVHAQQMGVVEVGGELVLELPRGVQVVAERLLHHQPGVPVEALGGQRPGDLGEQRRRDRQVVRHEAAPGHRLAQPREGAGVGEVPGDDGQVRREPGEDLLVDVRALGGDRRPRVPPQGVVVPVGGRHPDDGHGELAGLGEPVQRGQQHLLGEVAGDAEEHQDVGPFHLGRAERVLGHHDRPFRCVAAFAGVSAGPWSRPKRAFSAASICSGSRPLVSGR